MLINFGGDYKSELIKINQLKKKNIDMIDKLLSANDHFEIVYDIAYYKLYDFVVNLTVIFH